MNKEIDSYMRAIRCVLSLAEKYVNEHEKDEPSIILGHYHKTEIDRYYKSLSDPEIKVAYYAEKKNLGLDFAGWLWAVEHGKEEKYYADHYGFHNTFTKEVAGSIVKKFFMAEPKLLQMAYRSLSSDWSMVLWSTYPDLMKKNPLQTKVEIDFNDFTWLLFKSLSFNILDGTVKELVEGDCEKLWKDLDKEYPDKKEK